jgi:ribosomal protein L32
MPRHRRRVCGFELPPADPASRCPSCGTDRPTHWPCSRCGYDLVGASPRWGVAVCPECGLENASGLPPPWVDGAWFRWAGIGLLALPLAMLVPGVGPPVLGAAALAAAVSAAVVAWRWGWAGLWGTGGRGPADPPG